jgi:hypothetical protein
MFPANKLKDIILINYIFDMLHSTLLIKFESNFVVLCLINQIICMYSVFFALNGYLKFLKIPTKALGCMHISSLYSNNRHVSATHVSIFRVNKNTSTIIK